MNLFRERTFICLVVSLLLLVGALWLRPLLPRQNIDKTGIAKNLFWYNKKYSFKNANLIFLGSSRTYRGISPEDVGYYLHGDLKILNFGFSSGRLNPAIFKAAGKILTSEKGKFRGVALEISPVEFSGDNKHYNSITRKNVKNYFEHGIDPLSVELLKQYCIASPHGHYYEHFYSNGWVASNRIPNWPRKHYVEKLKKPDTRYRSNLKKYYRLFLMQVRRWKKEGIMVFGYRPYRPCNNNIDFNYGFDKPYFIAEFRRAGGIWLDVNCEGLSTYDGLHMDSRSARLYSRRLGKAMAEKVH